jgi:hypothetical protein
MVEFNESIKNKLDFFLKSNKIPNIIFHGASGSGKRTIVNDFVLEIYNKDKSLIQTYVMNVNCAHGKGIKFIREELKFFAKTHINIMGSGHFKTIILSNADKLTIDAQSALRRCIELFSHNTRFFIIVEDKSKLLKPIISRFCGIFITEPTLNSKRINLHKYGIQNSFSHNVYEISREKWLIKYMKTNIINTSAIVAGTGTSVAGTGTSVAGTSVAGTGTSVAGTGTSVAGTSVAGTSVAGTGTSVAGTTSVASTTSVAGTTSVDNTYSTLLDMSIQLYEKGYSGIDLINYIEKDIQMNNDLERKFHILFLFQKVKREFRNEKTFILFILHFLYFRSEKDLENISFM